MRESRLGCLTGELDVEEAVPTRIGSVRQEGRERAPVGVRAGRDIAASFPRPRRPRFPFPRALI